MLKSFADVPFVFFHPCSLLSRFFSTGYAVISAGIVYCVCRNIRSEASPGHTTSGSQHASERRPSEVSLQNCANCQTTSYNHPDSSHRLYWLDCDQAVGGLLGGSVVLAMTIVCLILFFIFKTRCLALRNTLIICFCGELFVMKNIWYFFFI